MAREISGWRCFGSSMGRGRKSNLEEDLVRERMFWASSSMVNSVGLPRLMGPGVWDWFIMEIIPWMRSST